jgi:hypothetical protein
MNDYEFGKMIHDLNTCRAQIRKRILESMKTSIWGAGSAEVGFIEACADNPNQIEGKFKAKVKKIMEERKKRLI